MNPRSVLEAALLPLCHTTISFPPAFSPLFNCINSLLWPTHLGSSLPYSHVPFLGIGCIWNSHFWWAARKPKLLHLTFGSHSKLHTTNGPPFLSLLTVLPPIPSSSSLYCKTPAAGLACRWASWEHTHPWKGVDSSCMGLTFLKENEHMSITSGSRAWHCPSGHTVYTA